MNRGSWRHGPCRRRAHARSAGRRGALRAGRGNWPICGPLRAMAQRHGDSYALGIHPLYTPQVGEDDIQAGCRGAMPAIGWWPGEIGWISPGLILERASSALPRPAAAGRRFDLPVILHVRRSADQLLKAPARAARARRHRPCLQRQPAQAQALIDLGLQLRLWWRRDLRTRAAAMRWRRAAAYGAGQHAGRTDAPDIPRTGSTAAQRAAGERPQQPNCRASAVVAALRGISGAELAAHAGQCLRRPCRGWRPCWGNIQAFWPLALIYQAQTAIKI